MFGVISTSTVSEPRTTATAATDFTGFRDDAAFGAYDTDGCRRCRGCWCVQIYVGIGQSKKMNTRKQSLLALREDTDLAVVSLGLTFTCLHALEPPVISVSVAGTSTMLIPTTARSATTSSAGFRERTTLWARHLITRSDG